MGADIGNTAGRGLGVINALIALRNGQFAQQQAALAAARNNPEVRAGLAGSPFSSGALGLSGQPRALPAPESPDPNIVNVPQQFPWQPNLPPLDPATQLKMAQASATSNLQQTNPDLFAAISGIASPQQFGNLIQNAPSNVSNLVASPGGLTQGSQPVPWNLLYRGAESQMYGGPGMQGFNYDPVTGRNGFGTSTPPSESRAPSGRSVAQPPQQPLTGAGAAPLPPSNPKVALPSPATWGQTAPQPPATLQGASPAQPAPSPIPGAVPFDPTKLGKEPLVGYPSAAFDDQNGQIGYPSAYTQGTYGAGVEDQPPIALKSLGGLKKRTTSRTTPFGSFGNQTVTEVEGGENALTKSKASGISSDLNTRLDVLFIGDNALTQILQQYSPDQLAGMVGPGTYKLQQGMANIPFMDTARRSLRSLSGRPEPTTSPAHFASLIEGLGIAARGFAGAAFTETERKIYAPSLIPDPTKPFDAFKQYLTNYGRSLARMAENTMLNNPQLHPATRAQLQSMIDKYGNW